MVYLTDYFNDILFNWLKSLILWCWHTSLAIWPTELTSRQTMAKEVSKRKSFTCESCICNLRIKWEFYKITPLLMKTHTTHLPENNVPFFFVWSLRKYHKTKAPKYLWLTFICYFHLHEPFLRAQSQQPASLKPTQRYKNDVGHLPKEASPDK